LQEILQQGGGGGAGNLSAPSRGTDATGEPAVEISVKGRDELVVRNLLKVTSRTIFLESAVLTYHCRELAVLAYPQKEKSL
jgi:hypothetical protein